MVEVFPGVPEEVLFILLTVITVGSAILALESREIVYGAFSLSITFLGVAGFFVLLEAGFIAMLQVLVFVGAVAVLFLFTVMLVRRERWLTASKGVEKVAGIVAGAAVAIGVAAVVTASPLTEQFVTQPPISYIGIGQQIVGEYWPALVVLGAVLASAMIGALTIAKLEKGEK